MTTTDAIAPSPRCTQCAGFGVDRPATITARYLPDSDGGRPGREELLCDSCGYDQWIYCAQRPLKSQPISAPITIEEINDALPISFFEIKESLPEHINPTLWVSKDGTQRVSFPTHTNMLLIATTLCARGFFTERTSTSRYCLKIARINR